MLVAAIGASTRTCRWARFPALETQPALVQIHFYLVGTAEENGRAIDRSSYGNGTAVSEGNLVGGAKVIT